MDGCCTWCAVVVIIRKWVGCLTGMRLCSRGKSRSTRVVGVIGSVGSGLWSEWDGSLMRDSLRTIRAMVKESWRRRCRWPGCGELLTI
jgi:hypothetical protein